MYKIGWFSSGRGPGSRALLTTVYQQIQQGQIQAEIGFVFCNRETGQSDETDRFIQLVKSYNIPLVSFSSQKFRAQLEIQAMPDWRREYDKAVIKLIEGYQVNLCILAGYMLIISAEMCQKYNMINLHPAAPAGPTGTWQEVIWELIAKNAGTSGVMMHLVTPELDKGPVVSYCTFSVKGSPFDNLWEQFGTKSIPEIKEQFGEDNPLFLLIRSCGLERELPLIVSTINAFSSGEIQIEKGAIVDRGGNPLNGYNLTSEIDNIKL